MTILIFIIISILFWWPLHNILMNAFIEANPKYLPLEKLEFKILIAFIIFPINWIMHPSFIFSYIRRKNKKLTYYEFLVDMLIKQNV